MPESNKIDLPKTFGFLLLLIAICVFFFTVLIIPTIREYKRQNGVYKIEYASYLKAKEEFDAQNAKLATLEKTNSKVISALGKATNEKALSSLASAYFKNVSIQKIGGQSKHEGAFFYDDYNMSVNYSGVKQMLSFLKAVEEDGSILKVEAPLTMEGNEKEGLSSHFVMRVYKKSAGAH